MSDRTTSREQKDHSTTWLPEITRRHKADVDTNCAQQLQASEGSKNMFNGEQEAQRILNGFYVEGSDFSNRTKQSAAQHPKEHLAAYNNNNEDNNNQLAYQPESSSKHKPQSKEQGSFNSALAAAHLVLTHPHEHHFHSHISGPQNFYKSAFYNQALRKNELPPARFGNW